ncbi:CAT1 [Symbiodinium pilosum]|uniref:CAT1 protein n=1 Tax=Symbiodinium pilosum TaxID=2952 RepID=A0A812YGB2_SYMPI|nr:CAT1 [Symbiodinium pilosum]
MLKALNPCTQSLGIGAFGCLLSAAAYAELSSRVVAAGSVYAYAQATGLGRSIMAVAALCLVVENIPGVARRFLWTGPESYCERTLDFLSLRHEVAQAVKALFEGKLEVLVTGLDPSVFLVLFCTALLARGTRASKLLGLRSCDKTEPGIKAKVGLILFLILGTLMAFDTRNLDSFFGFLGFDAVCALASDTKDAKRVVPSALFLGLFISGGLTCLAGFALVSAVPAARIDPSAGFVSAFEILGKDFAAAVVAVGELLVLPVVAFGCLLPLGRLLCCLAEDGFLPPQLAQRDSKDQPLLATLSGGAVTALCAGLVPFEDLNDICSAAVLTCFILASVCALVARQEGSRQAEVRNLLASFVACAFSASWFCSYP